MLYLKMNNTVTTEGNIILYFNSDKDLKIVYLIDKAVNLKNW
jgi:hypothetical protein